MEFSYNVVFCMRTNIKKAAYFKILKKVLSQKFFFQDDLFDIIFLTKKKITFSLRSFE